MTKAGTYNDVIHVGKEWAREWAWRDSAGALVNLTGYTAVLKVRDALDAVLFVCNTEADLDAPGNTEGLITLGGVAGTIAYRAPADVTELLADSFGLHHYDLALINPDGLLLEPILEGTMRIKRTASR